MTVQSGASTQPFSRGWLIFCLRAILTTRFAPQPMTAICSGILHII